MSDFSTLELEIIPVLGLGSAELARDFRIIVERLTKDAEKIGKATGRSASDVAAEYGKGAKKVLGEAAKSGRDLNKLEAALGRERLAIVEAFERRTAQNEREARYDRRREADRDSRQRLQDERSAHQTSEREQKAAAARELEQQRSASRSLYVQEQASEARRTARARAFYGTLSRVTQTGFQGIAGVASSWFTRRERQASESGTRLQRIEQRNNQLITQAQSLGINAQVAEVSRGARRRLAAVEAAAVTERTVITRNAVKAAEAQAAIQAKTSTGVIGAATGRSNLGGGLLAGLGAGFAGRKILTTVADFQSIETAFKGIFEEVEGSAPRTEAFLKEMQEFAKQTPYGLRDLSTYAQKFFAAGLVDPESATAVEDLKDKLLKLSDAASATGKTQTQVEGGLLGITQIAASGRASLEDLRQIAEGTGVSFKLISANLGMTTGEMFKALEKGSISAEDALDAVFKGMTQIPGAAGASARQAKNLRGALSSLMDVVDQGIIKVFKPLGEQLALLISGLAGFLGKVLDGQGAFEILRRGLAGVAIALGAVLAAKGAIQVLSLLGSGLKLLVAANPAILVLVALGAAVAVLPKVAPGVSRFFKALYDGSRLVGKAGYDLGRPIEGLSKLVLLQSSVGAAARTIVDGLRRIYDVFLLWRAGAKDFGDVTDVIGQTLAKLGDQMGPAKDALVDGFRTMFDRAEEYLGQRLNSGPVAQLRANVGSYLLAVLGLTGGGGGVVSRVLSTAITKLFFAGIKNFDSTTPATEMGERTKEIVNKALQSVSDFRFDVGAFFSSLFSGNAVRGEETAAASSLGLALNNIVSGAFKTIAERVGPVAEFLANIGKAITTGFTKYVLPGLLLLPYYVGKFLSRTIFSEEFLKAFTVAAAGLAAAAIAIAGSFVVGFVQGLYERRGDILKAVTDIFNFVVKNLGLEGSPILKLGGLLVGAFVGSKVLAAISTLRGKFGVAMVGMRGDVQATQTALNKLNTPETKVTGSGSKTANAALAVGNAWRKTGDIILTAGRGVDTFANKTIEASGKVRKVTEETANKILNLPINATTNKAGQLIDRTTGRFLKKPTVEIGKFRTFVARNMLAVGNATADGLQHVGTATQTMARGVQTGFYVARGAARSLVDEVKKSLPEGFSAAQSAVLLGTSAVTGYMTGMADTAQAKAILLVSTAASVATAFAVGGPIVGGITAVVSAVSFFWGESTRAAKKESELQKAIAESQKATIDRLAGSYAAAFKEFGGTGVNERQLATLRVLSDDIQTDGENVRRFLKKFGGSFQEASVAAAQGTKAYEAYFQGLRTQVTEAIAIADPTAIKNFRKEFDAAVQVSGSTLKGYTIKADKVGEAVRSALSAFGEGTIDAEQFRQKLIDSGVDVATATDAYAAFFQTFDRGVSDSAGGRYLKGLSVALRDGIRDQELYNEAASQIQRELETTMGVADRFTSAWERMKSGIDGARTAYTDWLDATTGRQRSIDETTVSLFGRAETFATAEGPTAGEERRLAELDAARDLEGVIANLARESGGNLDVLKSKLGEYFDAIRSNPGIDQGTIDFLDRVQASVSPDALIFALDKTFPPIKTIEEFKTKFQGLLQDPAIGKGIQIRLREADDFGERERIIRENLEALAYYDPTVKTYLKDNGVEETIKRLLEDLSIFDGKEVTARVNLKTRLDSTLQTILGGLPGFSVDGERWGGIKEFARGGMTQAHVAKRQLIRYAEPETGGEAFIPRRGNRSRSRKILQVAAGWLGGSFIPGKVTPMRRGGLLGTLEEKLLLAREAAQAAASRNQNITGDGYSITLEDGSVIYGGHARGYFNKPGSTASPAAASTARDIARRVVDFTSAKDATKRQRPDINWSGNDGDITFGNGLKLSADIVRRLMEAAPRQQLSYSGRPGSTKPSYKDGGALAYDASVRSVQNVDAQKKKMLSGTEYLKWALALGDLFNGSSTNNALASVASKPSKPSPSGLPGRGNKGGFPGASTKPSPKPGGSSYDEAVAKVIALDAEKKRTLSGPDYLEWAMALGRLFSGGTSNPFAAVPTGKLPPLPGRSNKGLGLNKPTLSNTSTATLPTNSVTFGQHSGGPEQRIDIKREVNVPITVIDKSGNPTMTALEVSRRAADADFMAGGDLWEVPKR